MINKSDRTVTGRDLAAERVRAGLTQAALGELIGVSGRRIANVEAEAFPPPSIVERIWDAIAEYSAR